MMMKRSCLVIISLVLFAGLSSRALADDGYWGDDTTPIDIDGIGAVSELDLADHYDADPWKGWGILTAKNNCYDWDDWGDFHLRIKEVWNLGNPCNVTDVVFDEDQAPQLWVKEYLGSGQYASSYVQYTDQELDWNIGSDGTTMDLLFYDNPIEYRDKAIIKVYTDNTSWHREKFKISVYPTPVPEPATIGLLGLGALALLRKRK